MRNGTVKLPVFLEDLLSFWFFSDHGNHIGYSSGERKMNIGKGNIEFLCHTEYHLFDLLTHICTISGA